MSNIAFIALGSNLEDPVGQLQQAMQELAALPNSELTATSSLYASKPMGPQDQPDYVNAVARLATELEPIALLDALQHLENEHHRVRQRRWGPRTLDLDIVLYNQQRINHPRLQVPHIGMHERNFVLYPLAEIDNTVTLPDGTGMAALLDNCPLADLIKLDL